MRYPVFASFALLLFLVAACQNTPTAGSDPTSSSDPNYPPVSIAPIAPSDDPDKLREQIMTDFLAAKQESKKLAPAYEESFGVIKTMKMHWGTQGASEKEHIERLVQDAMKFRVLYEEHGRYAAQLDSLFLNVTNGTLKLEDAQSEYVEIRTKLLTAGGRLPTAQERVQAVKSEFERDFPGASRQE